MVVVVGRIFLERKDDHTGSREPRDVIAVTVWVVTDASFAEPNGLENTECVMKYLLVPFARQAGVSNLHVREQALLGDEHRTFAIGFNGAALDHDSFTRIRPKRLDSWELRNAGDGLAYPRIEFIV